MFAPTVVQLAELPPFSCILTGAIDGPFVDCGVQVESLPMQNPRAYLSEVSAYQVGKAIGMVTGQEHQRLIDENLELQRRLEESERELDLEMQKNDHIAGLVTDHNLVVRKQTGRPKTKKEAV